MNRFILLLTLIVPFLSIGQEDIIFEDYVYVTNIKSVKFSPQGQPLSLPVAYLTGGTPLVLTFDDLDNEVRDYTYEIIHCNRDWTPSSLSSFEYLEGIQLDQVRQFNNSSTTLIPYINYTITLPNQSYRWTKSGNYLLVVYEGEKEENLPIITRRFMVVDNQLSAQAKSRRVNSVSLANSHQVFDINLQLNKNVKLTNPLSSVQATILQNGRWDSAINNVRPLFEFGNKIVIDNKGTYAFPAGNEFRALDIRSLVYGANGIHSIDLEEDKTSVFVELSGARKNKAYITYPDADGQFVIGSQDKVEYTYTEDYAEVVFTLQSPELDQDVYIVGAFNDWKMEDTNRMNYNQKHNAYVGVLNLKQGFYDYAFAVDKDGKLDLETFEGNLFQTNNKYQIFTYYRKPGSRYDQLIGFSIFESSVLGF